MVFDQRLTLSMVYGKLVAYSVPIILIARLFNRDLQIDIFDIKKRTILLQKSRYKSENNALSRHSLISEIASAHRLFVYSGQRYGDYDWQPMSTS